MNYQVFIRRPAQKSLLALPKHDYEIVRDATFALSANPRPHGCKKLNARDGWRIRVGQYRVIYTIDDGMRLVRVTHIGHRGDIYRGLN
jgi:mRNA interferase RelE/StbE